MAEHEGSQPEQDPKYREPASSDAVERLADDVGVRIGENAYAADQGLGVTVGYFRQPDGEHYVRAFLHDPDNEELEQDLSDRLEAGEVSPAYVNHERSLRCEIDEIAGGDIDEESHTYKFVRYTITEIGGEFHIEQIPLTAEIGGEILNPPMPPEHLAMLQEHDPAIVDYNLEMIGLFREKERQEALRDSGFATVSKAEIAGLHGRIEDVEAVPADPDVWPV